MFFDPARWLSALPDDLPISEINIPGSHNAAAINTRRRTRWTCQDHTINEQLDRGIRLLDIRLKPKRLRHRPTHKATHDATRNTGSYHFTTCHGHLGLFGANEFQSLYDVLEECTAFLNTNPRETLIITIQIDDWRGTPKHKHPEVIQALQARLSHLPLLLTPHIPTLGECRGRIFLLNRINDNPELGVPINIPDNTPGSTLTPTQQRHYEVYIQDQYKNLPTTNREDHKLDLVIKAFKHKRPNNILLNFASGTKPFGRLLHIQKGLLKYLATLAPHEASPVHLEASPSRQETSPSRQEASLSHQEASPSHHEAYPGHQIAPHHKATPQRLGWLLLDYPFSKPATRQSTPDPVTGFIASNFENH